MMWLLLACTGPTPTDTAVAAGDTRTVVMSSVGFARRNDDGTTWGFDLDQHVSDADDDEGCGHADLVDPDGLTGVDSAFSGMVPALEASEAGAVEELVADSVRNGELLILVELSGVDDPLNDECVDVRILGGTGTPLLGTDGEVLDGQTFALDPGAEPQLIPCVPLVDGSVRAGPFPLNLDLQVLDVELSFHMEDAFVRLDLAEDGRAGWGYFGGAVPVEDLLVIVSEEDLADIADLVTGLVMASADLHPGPDGCEALSVVFEYDAIEAFSYEE